MFGSGGTLWVDRHFVLQGGASGLYAYIGTNPTDQILGTYGFCAGAYGCTASIMLAATPHGVICQRWETRPLGQDGCIRAWPMTP